MQTNKQNFMSAFQNLTVSEKWQFIRYMTRSRKVRELTKNDLKEILASRDESELLEIIKDIKTK